MMTTQVRVQQGSQPRFADVRVGIMRTAERDGRAVAQLAVRSPRRQEILVVDVGDEVELHGAGTLRVLAITAPAEGRGEVELAFEPAG